MVFNALTPLLIGSAIILIVIAIWSWRFRNTPGAKPFALLSLSCAIYSLGYAMEISFTTLEAIFFWLRVEYVGIALLPAFLLLFALTYTGRSRIWPPVLALIFVIPLLTLVFFNTNEMHELYYQAVRLSTEGPFPVISFERGVWYWVQTGYIAFATLLSNFLFLQMFLNSARVYRRQISIILIGSLVPWGVHIIYLTGWVGWNLDLIPFAFTFSGVLFFFGLFRYRLFDLLPAARAALFEELPDGVLVLDRAGRIVDMNSRARQYLQLQPGVLGRLASEVLQDWPRLTPLMGDMWQKHQLQLHSNTPEENSYFNIDILPLQDKDGTVNGQMILLRDISRQRRVEVALQQSEKKLKAAFESSHDAITISSEDGKLIDSNQRALEIFGLESKDDFLAIRPADLSPPQQPDGRNSFEVSRELIGEAMTQGSHVRFEWQHLRKDGSAFPAEVTLTSYRLDEEVFLQANISDITARKLDEERLQYLSMHDALTGLYNRAYFDEEMNRLSVSREYPITIISADLDGLKLINDTMGHVQGDAMLKACADILRKSLRGYDIVARIGGDEFAVILPRTEEASCKEIVRRIRMYCTEHNIEYHELPLHISLGVATAQSGSIPLEDIYKKADDMMYRDKLERKPGVRSHTVDMLLAALKERDYVSEGHNQRLSGICLRMGEKINLSATELINLALLAQVHDLGLVSIPHQILSKKAALNDDEWEMMRLHPEKGSQIALSSPDLADTADLILKHHERWDGSGYPGGLKGEAIPIECRIFAIADAYDVMTSHRPYRRAKSREEALAELKRCAGTQFQNALVDVFFESMG